LTLTYRATLHDQGLTNNRLATPALPARSSSPTWYASITGVKSGLTTYKTASTNSCPKRAAGPTTLRLRYDPATPRTGAKGSQMQLTPLQLHESGRRGWPDGPQRVTAEEEDRGLRPVVDACRAMVATEKLANTSFNLKDNNCTHLEHGSMAKTRQQQVATPALPRLPLLQLGMPVSPVSNQD
jgi:hypothetical protein